MDTQGENMTEAQEKMFVEFCEDEMDRIWESFYAGELEKMVVRIDELRDAVMGAIDAGRPE